MVSIVWLAKLCKTKINQCFTQSENEQATLKTFRICKSHVSSSINVLVNIYVLAGLVGTIKRHALSTVGRLNHAGTVKMCEFQSVTISPNISISFNSIQYRYDFMLGDFTYPRMSIGTIIFRISAFWLHLIRRPWNEHEALKNCVAICSIYGHSQQCLFWIGYHRRSLLYPFLFVKSFRLHSQWWVSSFLRMSGAQYG